MATGSGRPTIKDVARQAGVSVTAVSKALRNAYGVSDALREKVRAAVAALDYRPSTAARAMRGQTYTIGVLLNDIRNPFMADLLDGIGAHLDQTPYRALIGLGKPMRPIESGLIDAAVDQRMDGLIIIGPRLSSEELLEVAASIPLVVIGHYAPEAVTFDSVNNDDRRGAELVVGHFHANGRRRIAMLNLRIGDTEYGSVCRPREAGYRGAMAALGLADETRVVLSGERMDEIRAAARTLLLDSHRPDAVFCWADYFAYEFLGAVHDLGLRIPEDVAIAGYDNSRPTGLPHINLTSIDTAGEAMGRQAARLLVDRIEGRREVVHLMVDPRLVVRSSSGGDG